MNVAVLGASRKPERYSHKAVKLLAEEGHRPFPVHPGIREIDGLKAYRSLLDVEEPIDTVTVYVSAKTSSRVQDEIVACGAKRVILNPGAENAELGRRLSAIGVEVVEACTLVLLKTGQF